MNIAEKFSVYQFFQDGEYEKVRDQVGLLNAMEGAAHYCSSVAAELGMVSRVIITDDNDDCVFEWKEKEGITFPSELAANSGFAGQAGQGKTTVMCNCLI